jgi:hypothetical protein
MTEEPASLDRYDIAIRGGTLVGATGRIRADLGISGERIAAIVVPDVPLDAARRSRAPSEPSTAMLASRGPSTWAVAVTRGQVTGYPCA